MSIIVYIRNFFTDRITKYYRGYTDGKYNSSNCGTTNCKYSYAEHRHLFYRKTVDSSNCVFSICTYVKVKSTESLEIWNNVDLARIWNVFKSISDFACNHNSILFAERKKEKVDYA